MTEQPPAHSAPRVIWRAAGPERRLEKTLRWTRRLFPHTRRIEDLFLGTWVWITTRSPREKDLDEFDSMMSNGGGPWRGEESQVLELWPMNTVVQALSGPSAVQAVTE